MKESFAFEEQYLGGAKEMKPRWKRCVESTDALLGEALGRKYVEKHFPPEAKARMQELVKNLLLAMGDTIRGLDVDGAADEGEGPGEARDLQPEDRLPRQVEGLLEACRSGATRCWANVAAGRKWNVDDDRAQIGKPVDRGRWGMTPPTSNAYYNPLLNEIVFPAGILQPPAFGVDATDAVNYGAIGVVIGHEISHGFDDQGAQYDAQGRLRNWWTPADLAKFQERGQCVVDQFEGYFIEPEHPPQRQAGPRRVDRRPRRREDRLPRLPEVAGRASRPRRRSTASRPSSSSSSPGASSAATPSARRPSG